MPSLASGDALADLRLRADSYFQSTGRPYVTLTYAQSLDGSIARPGGAPLQISGDEASAYTHRIRACHDAILVGVDTVLNDDPRLTTRLVEGPNPRVIVLDSLLRTPHRARLFDVCTRSPLVATTPAATASRAAALRAAGAEVVSLPADPDGRVDLTALVDALGRQGIRSLMVEGGSAVIASFLCQRLVQRLIVTVALSYVGGKPVLPPSLRCGEVERTQPLPRVEPLHLFWKGHDLILHGTPLWT